MKTDNTFESLLVNEQKELLRHAYALVGQREEAEELLQEVALRVLEKKDKFRSEEHTSELQSPR